MNTKKSVLVMYQSIHTYIMCIFLSINNECVPLNFSFAKFHFNKAYKNVDLPCIRTLVKTVLHWTVNIFVRSDI